MNLSKSIRRILKEETSLEKKVENLIDTKGLKVASVSLGGIESIGRILRMKPTVVLSKYLHGKVFSIDDGGYNIKFTIKHIEDNGDYHYTFYYDIIEGTGTFDNNETFDLLNSDIRFNNDFYLIKFDIRSLFNRFSDKLCDEYNLDYADIEINVTSERDDWILIR